MFVCVVSVLVYMSVCVCGLGCGCVCAGVAVDRTYMTFIVWWPISWFNTSYQQGWWWTGHILTFIVWWPISWFNTHMFTHYPHVK